MSVFESQFLFLILLICIVAVPGMDMIFVLTNALAGGKRAGLAATSGMMAGGACHSAFGGFVVAGVLGFAPVIARPMLIAGALYMAWIGFSLARSAIVIDQVQEEGRIRRLSKIVFQALATCLLNPKAWLFTLAVYPQFVRPDHGPVWLQVLSMGAMTVAAQGVIYGGLALAAAKGRDLIVTSPALTIWLGRGAGYLLIAAAAVTLVEGWR